MINIVEKIDKMRVERGLTVYAITDTAGISQQTYHQWLGSNTCPSIPVLEKICEVLNITLAELFCKNNLVELTPETKELYNKWICLSKDEQSSIKQIVDTYIKNKQK